MTQQTTAAPRSQLPVVDPKTGQASAEWYKFMVYLRNAVGPSPTATDDSQILAIWSESK